MAFLPSPSSLLIVAVSRAGSMVYSSWGSWKCQTSLDYCLCEEVDLKVADSILFFILYSLEKRLSYSWKLGI